MLRLPYWDPSRFTVVDSMHAFYLRIFRYHIRDIWGMDVNFDDEEIIHEPFSTQPTEPEMKQGNYVLRYGSTAMLRALSPSILRRLCWERNELSMEGDVSELVTELTDYVGAHLRSHSAFTFLTPSCRRISAYVRVGSVLMATSSWTVRPTRPGAAVASWG